YDKIEIEAISKEIGTYELSIIRSDGCLIVPSRPITEADPSKIQKFDVSAGLDELVSDAAENTIRLS
ncbi:MAG: tRNA 4-thiouridine(8) synthase ThiI, partial [Candidatus Methanoplasma sp.]|nr:tRNA 4-thiouridine(8) synthase ThiI [Candidatus Methanoplasma sp.]